MKKRYLTVLSLFFLFVIVQMDVAHAADTTNWQKLLLGDHITNREGKQDVGYMEEMLAGLITAIPRWIRDMLNLEDISKLVLQVDNNWVFHTFPKEVWGSVSTFYNIMISATAYLMALGLVGWGIVYLSRAASAGVQFTLKDMVQGFVIYLGGIWLASYLFEIIFTINDFLVYFAKTAMANQEVPTDMDFLNIFTILDDRQAPNLGSSLMYLIVVISVGILNYQYSLRMLVLAILIIIFPVCAYSSFFSVSRKSLDMWFREFCSQVFMNAGHALGYALFLILMKKGASNWILFAFLMGMPQITGVIRLIVGAPGGMVGGSMGLGSAAAITQMLRSSKGGVTGGGMNFSQPNTTFSNAASNVASSALGFVAPKANPFISQAIGKINSLSPQVKTLGKIAALTTASVGGAMVGGALMGEKGAAMGAAGGIALAKKGMPGNGNGSGVMTSSFDGENHRMNVRLPLAPNASHEQAWSMAQNKSPEGYNLKSVNLTPKGWMASIEKPNAPMSTVTPRPTRRVDVSGINFNSNPSSPSNVNRRVGGMNLARQPATVSSNQTVGQRGQTFPNQNASPRTTRPSGQNVVPPIGTTTVKNNPSSSTPSKNGPTGGSMPNVTIGTRARGLANRAIPVQPNGTSSTVNSNVAVPNVRISTRAKQMAGNTNPSQTVETSTAPKTIQPTIQIPTRNNDKPPHR